VRAMMDDNQLLRWLWPVLASLAGAVTALSFRPYAKMSPIDIVMALCVGTTFALFVSPWVAHAAFGYEPPGIRVVGALYYLMASGSNVLIPFAIRWLKKFIGSQNAGDET
jgi:hypothetical protein